MSVLLACFLMKLCRGILTVAPQVLSDISFMAIFYFMLSDNFDLIVRDSMRSMEYAPKTYSSAGVVIGEDNNLLLVQEFGFFWGLPRGHIEPEESPIEAVRREIAEEAGITDLTEISELGSYTRYTFSKDGLPNFKEIKHITVFAFLTKQNQLSPSDRDITKAIWVDPERASSMLINKEDISFLEEAIVKLKKLNYL